jgi:two-component system, cell cycle response regulator
MKFLIAVPDPGLSLMLEQAAARFGGETLRAEDGHAAWRLAQTQPGPLVVLAAQSLPGIDGTALCELMKRDSLGAAVHFVLVVTSADGTDVEKAGQAGVDDVLLGPFEPALLHVRFKAAQAVFALRDRVDAAEAEARAQQTRDPVTGTLNRRAILALLEREAARAARDRAPLAVLVVAVDDLGGVANRHGDEAADQALSETCRRVERLLRPYDGLGRYADDELLVVLPMCDAGRAAGVATRVRNHVATDAVQTRTRAVSVTVSVGIASGSGDACTRDGLAHAARDLARQAQAAGGNRVLAGQTQVPDVQSTGR